MPFRFLPQPCFPCLQGWGLFNYFQVPAPVAILVSVAAMDFIIYLQHVLVHAVPALWRLHRVHHADIDFDVTTGARFHPIEIILSMLIKFANLREELELPDVARAIAEQGRGAIHVASDLLEGAPHGDGGGET